MIYQKIDKPTLLSFLKTYNLTINFTKLNGQERIIHCTLRPDSIHKKESEDSLSSRKNLSKNNISVWDLDKNEWRSFRLESVNFVDYYLGD